MTTKSQSPQSDSGITFQWTSSKNDPSSRSKFGLTIYSPLNTGDDPSTAHRLRHHRQRVVGRRAFLHHRHHSLRRLLHQGAGDLRGDDPRAPSRVIWHRGADAASLSESLGLQTGPRSRPASRSTTSPASRCSSRPAIQSRGAEACPRAARRPGLFSYRGTTTSVDLRRLETLPYILESRHTLVVGQKTIYEMLASVRPPACTASLASRPVSNSPPHLPERHSVLNAHRIAHPSFQGPACHAGCLAKWARTQRCGFGRRLALLCAD